MTGFALFSVEAHEYNAEGDIGDRFTTLPKRIHFNGYVLAGVVLGVTTPTRITVLQVPKSPDFRTQNSCPTRTRNPFFIFIFIFFIICLLFTAYS